MRGWRRHGAGGGSAVLLAVERRGEILGLGHVGLHVRQRLDRGVATEYVQVSSRTPNAVVVVQTVPPKLQLNCRTVFRAAEHLRSGLKPLVINIHKTPGSSRVSQKTHTLFNTWYSSG